MVDRAGRSALHTWRDRLEQMRGVIGLQVADAIGVEEGKGRSLLRER